VNPELVRIKFNYSAKKSTFADFTTERNAGIAESARFLKTSALRSNYLANFASVGFPPHPTLNLGRSGTRWIHPLLP
jgi:hypothetical protein